jgi:hypothetical protein
MSMDLNPLLEKAFFTEEVENASEAVERALDKFEEMTHIGARPFEVVVPVNPDEDWLRDRFVSRLVYVCESEGMPIPKCGGTIIALFIGRHMYAIAAEQAIRFGCDVLDTTVDELHAQYGTHDLDTALR